MHPTGTYLAASLVGASPYINWWKRSGDVWTKLTSPAASSGACGCCDWHPSGEYLAAGGDTAPKIYLYRKSGDTLTKLADSVADYVPGTTIFGMAWDPTGRFLVVCFTGSPYIACFEFDDVAETLTKIANPSTLPNGDTRGAAWLPNGDLLALSTVNSPYLNLYTHGTWNDVPAAGTGSGPVEFADSGEITNHEPTTQQMASGEFDAGEVLESNPSTDIEIKKDSTTEIEGVFKFNSDEVDVSPAPRFWFRVVEEDG
jgi:hypothetical protein